MDQLLGVLPDEGKLLGYPLVPLGRNPGHAITEQDSQGNARTYHWDTLRFTYRVDLRHAPQPPSTSLYDVYYGLLSLFWEAGCPEDNRVRFDRMDFLRRIDWLVNESGRGRRPSGRHYRKLEHLLLALCHTTYSLGHDTTNGEYRILSAVHSGKAKPGPRPAAPRSDGGASYVEFGRNFGELLRSSSQQSPIDLRVYFALPPGGPRVLYRTLQWLRSEKTTEIKIKEMLQRMGSIQSHYRPSAARKILKRPVHELMQQRVLADREKYTAHNDSYSISFSLGRAVGIGVVGGAMTPTPTSKDLPPEPPQPQTPHLALRPADPVGPREEPVGDGAFQRAATSPSDRLILQKLEGGTTTIARYDWEPHLRVVWGPYPCSQTEADICNIGTPGCYILAGRDKYYVGSTANSTRPYESAKNLQRKAGDDWVRLVAYAVVTDDRFNASHALAIEGFIIEYLLNLSDEQKTIKVLNQLIPRSHLPRYDASKMKGFSKRVRDILRDTNIIP